MRNFWGRDPFAVFLHVDRCDPIAARLAPDIEVAVSEPVRSKEGIFFAR